MEEIERILQLIELAFGKKGVNNQSNSKSTSFQILAKYISYERQQKKI